MKKRLFGVLLAMLVLLSSGAWAEENVVASTPQDASASLFAQMSGNIVAVQTGTISGEVAQAVVPDVQINYYNSQTDCLAALRAGKADAWCTDEPVARFLMIDNRDLDIYAGKMNESSIAAVFARTDEGQTLCDQYSAFVDELWANGTMDEIDAVWFGADEDKCTVLDYETLPDTNGTLRMALDTSILPFSYVKDNRIVGYDVDIAARFCENNGYRLEVVPMDFGGMLPAVQSGKCDFAACCITVTEERRESVLFSSPTYHSGTVPVVLKDTGSVGAAADTRPEFTTFADLNGKRVSLIVGAPFEELVRSKAPDVAEISYYNSQPDLIQALKSGKTDAFLMNNAVSQLVINKNPELTVFPHSFLESEFGIAFAKGDPRRDTWQAVYDSLPRDDVEAVWEKWTGVNDTIKILPEQDWPGLNGTVHAAVCDTMEPMSYIGEGGKPMGFDLEIILMIARELDVKVEFTEMEFSAILASVQAGKADLGAGCIVITEERADAVDFVRYYPAAFVLAVRAVRTGNEAQKTLVAVADGGAPEAGTSFLDGVRDSFQKTFLRENRWQLFLEGIGTTLLITALSILFGTALGFGVFMLCRNGNPVANAVTRFCVWLVQGMPVVVLLMILYYIIFGQVAISGTAVSVVGFTLVFGAAVYAMLRSGVGAIDRGQTEAAYALGYTDRKAFYRVVLPQALPHFMPAYKGEITALIKATAVVGYVAVQDLTKMGDIVRSRTYEAFFPLIAVAVIYFILAAILTFIVDKIEIRIDPRRRPQESILNGVDVQ